MNKALLPAFFLLGSLILGVSVIVPQFANAQGEQKVNEQQMQALKLFFNAQNPDNTKGNQQLETSSSSSSNSKSSQVQSEQVQQPQVAQLSHKQDQQSTNDNQPVVTTSNPQTANIEKVRSIQQQAKAMQQAQAEQQAQIQAQIE